MEKGLHIQGLCISSNSQTLVENINIKLGPSKCLALIGESGSGKTLTGLAIGGLLPRHIQINKGKILLDGKVIDFTSENDVQKIRGQNIAFILQNYASAFSPHISLDKQLHETLSTHSKLNRKQQTLAIAKALKEVDLSYEFVKNKYCFQLSGGQLQRVSIAAAIMLEPRLIIADEPTTALDPKTSKQILDLINSLKHKKDLSILLTTHDLNIARSYADEIAVMYRGSIVDSGAAQELLEHASHPYTKKLLTAESLVNGPTIAKVNLENKRESIIEYIHHSKSPTLLEVRNLNKKYTSKRPILNDFSLEIKVGECVGVIGPSGCGKSTLARCIMQLEPFNAGEIHFKGRKMINNLKESKMAGSIQAVFQHPGLALNDQLRILDSLMEPLDIVKRTFAQSRQYRNKRLSIATHLLEQVNLSSEHLYRFPNQLSGGQKQRVCIARAISTEPEFLILDEPTASLDMLVQSQIIKLLQDLQNKIGYSSLIISHDYNSLKELTHRIISLEKETHGESMT